MTRPVDIVQSPQDNIKTTCLVKSHKAGQYFTNAATPYKVQKACHFCKAGQYRQ
jgi:hypothetical protein